MLKLELVGFCWALGGDRPLPIKPEEVSVAFAGFLSQLLRLKVSISIRVRKFIEFKADLGFDRKR